MKKRKRNLQQYFGDLLSKCKDPYQKDLYEGLLFMAEDLNHLFERIEQMEGKLE